MITGNIGANRLLGLAGDDRLHGGEGNDRLEGGHGADRLYGGGGNDSYIVGDTTDYVYEGYDGGTDSVYSSISHALRANVERLYLTGTAGVNGTGNELANIVTGNVAANLLRGLGGNDVIRGAGGDDRIEGGTGRDQSYGGTGADQFVFRPGDFAGATAATADIVRDFQAEGDLLNLDALDANSTLTGRQNFTFIGAAQFSGTAGELRFEQTERHTFVSGDTNGDGVADFMIRLDGLHTLTAAISFVSRAAFNPSPPARCRCTSLRGACIQVVVEARCERSERRKPNSSAVSARSGKLKSASTMPPQQTKPWTPWSDATSSCMAPDRRLRLSRAAAVGALARRLSHG